MLSFLRHRWFLIALVSVLMSGILWPGAMRHVSSWLNSNLILASVTFIMALPLEAGVLWRAVRRPGPAWVGSILSSGIAPPLGWLASRWLPAELAAGLVLAATVPSTLASAAVLTRRAGGNDAVAFLVTMITNLACFIVVPAWLTFLLSLQAQMDFGKVVLDLVIFVVLPIVAAQLLRQWRLIGSASLRHKGLLSGLAQIGILSMVLIGAVMCGHRIGELNGSTILSAGNVAILIVTVVLFHFALLGIGFGASRAMSFDRGDAVAVAFSGSQKTLMIGTYLAMLVGPLAILPMVAYHAAQLIIDTLIADSMRQRGADASNPEL